MLMGSDSELTLALGYDDLPRRALSETLLKQEEIFRNQVVELHRLYQTQKILTKDLEMKVGCGENSRLFVGSFPKHLKCEYIATDVKLGEDKRSLNNHCLPEHRGTKHQLRPLDLQLSASNCTNNDEHLLPKIYGCVALRISSKMRYEACGDNVSSMEDLELSLRAGSYSCQEQGSKDICSQSGQGVCSQELPDGNFINQPAVGYSIHDSGRSGKCDALGRILDSSPLTNEGRKLEEERYFNQGIERYNRNIGCKNMPMKRKLFASSEVEQLDLNKPMPDESFDHWIPSSSKVSAIHTSHDGGGEPRVAGSSFLNVNYWKTLMNNSLNEDTKGANSTLTSPNKSTCNEPCGSVLVPMDLGSNCGSPLDHKDLDGSSGNFKPRNARHGMSSSDKTCQSIVHSRKNKGDNLHSSNSSEEVIETTDSNASPVSCKSWITDDESSNTKTRQCGTDVSNSNLPLVQQKLEPSVGLKAQAPDQQNEDMAEVDLTVRKGAVSLTYLSMEYSARNRAPLSKGINKSHGIEKEVPQCSSESYEAVVLKQLECSPDEYCVSSTAFETRSWNHKDSGIKVKRGRRMKDFRKDILPGLASLSRQEINEDVKIMEVAIRSREGRKQNSKSNHKTRSRKSRINKVGRRCYS